MSIIEPATGTSARPASASAARVELRQIARQAEKTYFIEKKREIVAAAGLEFREHAQ